MVIIGLFHLGKSNEFECASQPCYLSQALDQERGPVCLRASLWLKTAKFWSRLGTCRQTGVGLTQINSASVLVLRQTVKWGFCGLLGEPGLVGGSDSLIGYEPITRQ